MTCQKHFLIDPLRQNLQVRETSLQKTSFTLEGELREKQRLIFFHLKIIYLFESELKYEILVDRNTFLCCPEFYVPTVSHVPWVKGIIEHWTTIARWEPTTESTRNHLYTFTYILDLFLISIIFLAGPCNKKGWNFLLMRHLLVPYWWMLCMLIVYYVQKCMGS